MATYREIHGKAIRDISADLSEDNQAGEIFYNSSTNTFRSIVQSVAWSSASPMITARYSAGSGTQTAALASGGYNGSNSALTEEYNGTGFSTGGALPTAARGAGAAGTQTATIYAGGYESSNTGEAYTYNGTAWTGIPALNTARRSLSQNMAGTTTAAIVAGGLTGVIADSEEYNGSSWSEGNNLNTARADCAAGGIQTASFLAGGGTPSTTTATELYDGTSWTAGGSLNTARKSVSGGGAQTAGIVFGGDTGSVSALTETFDGTSWTETADMATARHSGAPANQPGANSSTLVAGGVTSDYVTTTEEFTVSTSVITAAAFSSGGSMGNARYGGNFFGSGKSSQVAVGGQKAAVPPTANNIADSETYDGTSWSEGNNLGTARFNGSGTGTETAGLVATGRNPAAAPAPQVYYANVEEYNGTSYSEVNDCPQAAYRRCGAGTQTATIIVGGLIPPAPTTDYSTTSNEYDGTNWSSGGAAPFKANYMDGVGVTTAAVVFGGQQDPAINNASYDYDGSSWTANSNMNISHGGQHLVAGTVTDAIIAGGGAPYAVAAQAETYDGTTFSTNATLAQGGQRGGKGSTTANAIGCGGYAPGYLTATEEYTAASTAANVKTITTS